MVHLVENRSQERKVAKFGNAARCSAAAVCERGAGTSAHADWMAWLAAWRRGLLAHEKPLLLLIRRPERKH